MANCVTTLSESANKCESTNTTNERTSKSDKMQARTVIADGVVNRSLVKCALVYLCRL